MKAKLLAADGSEYELADVPEGAAYVIHRAPPDMTGAVTGERRECGPEKQYRSGMYRIDPVPPGVITHAIYLEWDLGVTWPPQSLVSRAEAVAADWFPPVT